MVQARFGNEHIPSEVLGIGMDPAPDYGDSYRRRYGDGALVAYLGQVSEGKGVDELLALWDLYRESGGRGTLALAGTPRMALPKRDDVVSLGRVNDSEKWALLASADVLVLPSRFESLGIVLLEAWQVGTPVLVPTRNAVTAGQVARRAAVRVRPRTFVDSLMRCSRPETIGARVARGAREARGAFDARSTASSRSPRIRQRRRRSSVPREPWASRLRRPSNCAGVS